MRKTYSLYYGRPATANAFPGYTTEELLRDLLAPTLDAETRAKIEAEVTRRDRAVANRRAKRSRIYR